MISQTISQCGLGGTVNNKVGASYCDTTHWFLDFFWVVSVIFQACISH